MSRLAGYLNRKEYGNKLIRDYIHYFSQSSVKNELYGKISLHVVLGQALKNIHYKMGNRKIDIRVHLLLIKPQGTGKGAGFGVAYRFAQSLGLDFQTLTSSTDAGLEGTLEYDEVERERVVSPGLLQTADIIAMEEASVLFDLSGDFSKRNMTLMQITMNPLDDTSCHIDKKLGSHLISFKPHASFLLTTYPPDRLADKIVKTGFLDRTIAVFEDVTLEDRLEVMKHLMPKINSTSSKQSADEFDSVSKRLERVVEFANKHVPNGCMTIPQDTQNLLMQVIEEFAMKVLDASPKAREKLEHFISRLFETLLKLSIHHAILDLRNSIDVSDVAYARLTYLPIWTNLIISMESLLVISNEERTRRNQVILHSLREYDTQMKIGKFVKNKCWVRRMTMLENLRGYWDSCSIETADKLLSRIEKEPKTQYDKFMKCRAYNQDKFFEKRNIGGVAYIKKIKDIK